MQSERETTPKTKPAAKPQASAQNRSGSTARPPKKAPQKAAYSKSAKKNNRAAAQELYQKGNQLIASGSIKKGLSTLKQAQRADRSFAEVYRALATAYKMNGDSKNACKAIKQFLQKKTLGSKRQSAYQKRYCDS